MSIRGCTPPLLRLLSLFLLQVNIINSFQQETDDGPNQVKGESHWPLQRSKRRWVLTTLELQEEDPGPFPKLVGELFNNMSNNMSLMYLISGPGVDEFPEIGLFSIEDNKNGKIYVHRPVDREMTPSFMIHFDAMDHSTGKLVDESLIFHIRISDVNDHAPQFPEEEFDLSVKETHAAGQPIFQMLAVDLDQENTPNSQVLYFLISQTPSLKESGFRIDLMNGEIRLSGCLDYETAPRFTLLIRARDCGEPSLSTTATVHINVEESNNHMPTFTQDSYTILCSEGQVYQGALHLPVQDRDSPFTSAWRAEFSILDGNEEGHFDVVTDPETNQGILSIVKTKYLTRSSLKKERFTWAYSFKNYETQATHSLVIAVENQELLFSCEEGQQQPSRQALASATVSVQVVDVNDPPTFHPETFIVSKEDGARSGIQLGAFNATDPDGAASQIRYKLVHDPANWVAVDEISGVVTTRRQMDRESPHVNGSFYTIVAQAVDNGLPPRTGTGTLLLFLSDINDNAPALRSHSRYLEVCASAWSQPLLLEAEDSDLEPYADPFTFDLDTTWGHAADTWTLGTRQDEGRSAELLMLRSLPPGNYFIPLFIGDRQGFSQKQVVHVKVLFDESSFYSLTMMEAVDPTEIYIQGWLRVCHHHAQWNPQSFIYKAALLSLLRCYFEFGLKRHRSFSPSENGHQTLIVSNHESKATSAQVPQTLPAGGDQIPALSFNAAAASARLGVRGPNEMLPWTVSSLDQAPSALGTQGFGMFFEPRRVKNKSSTPVYLDSTWPRCPAQLMGGRMVETRRQKFHNVDVWNGDTDHLPRVYSEEGECEGAETLSSLTCSEQELFPELLDCWDPQAPPAEAASSGSGVPSHKHS